MFAYKYHHTLKVVDIFLHIAYNPHTHPSIVRCTLRELEMAGTAGSVDIRLAVVAANQLRVFWRFSAWPDYSTWSQLFSRRNASNHI